MLDECVRYIETEVRPAVASEPGSFGCPCWPARGAAWRSSNRS